MILRLKRFSYSPTETEGLLALPDGQLFATIEQPWVPNPNGALGGKPNHSCVPDGMYRLQPHESRSKGSVFILFAPALGVFKFPQDHAPGRGRNVCYIHIANWASELEGCIAPGMGRRPLMRRGHYIPEPAVQASTEAMARLRRALGKSQHLLSIESVVGASDVV